MRRHRGNPICASLDGAVISQGCAPRWVNGRRFGARKRDRAGYVLVLFTMLFLCLLGLAALVIDMGFARLAQRQMQSAVDSAALEGLRWQNVQQVQDLPPAWLADPNFQQEFPDLGSGTLSSLQADAIRRWAASRTVANLFTDSVDPSGGTTQYGAGPFVNFEGGVGPADLAAAQTIQQPGTAGNPPLYQPMTSGGTAGLELNPSNETAGDMVAGTYNSGQPSAEADDYTRADFAPSSGSGSAATAFLVRMRRTPLWNVPGSTDDNPGISTAGPPLPVLFGRGSMMARSGSTGQLSVSSGITVRATAIASTVPAMAVGPAYSVSAGTTTAQIAPFAIRSDVWANLNVSGGSAVSIDLSGSLANAGSGSGVLLLSTTFSASLAVVGQTLAPHTTASDAALIAGAGAGTYVPIYEDLPSQPATIVGFAYYTQWNYSQPVLVLSPAVAASMIGSQNVSGTLAIGLPPALSLADTATLFQQHAAMANPLYAPALVNRYVGTNQ